MWPLRRPDLPPTYTLIGPQFAIFSIKPFIHSQSHLTHDNLDLHDTARAPFPRPYSQTPSVLVSQMVTQRSGEGGQIVGQTNPGLVSRASSLAL